MLECSAEGVGIGGYEWYMPGRVMKQQGTRRRNPLLYGVAYASGPPCRWRGSHYMKSGDAVFRSTRHAHRGRQAEINAAKRNRESARTTLALIGEGWQRHVNMPMAAPQSLGRS